MNDPLMKTLQITCIMEKELEDPRVAHTNAWVYEFAEAIAKLAEEHGLRHRIYHDVLEGKSHFQQ
tara:strand:+ start:601 stop:795 length:195 start_codon:yes stop_codon:yes gene_type:complete